MIHPIGRYWSPGPWFPAPVRKSPSSLARPAPYRIFSGQRSFPSPRDLVGAVVIGSLPTLFAGVFLSLTTIPYLLWKCLTLICRPRSPRSRQIPDPLANALPDSQSLLFSALLFPFVHSFPHRILPREQQPLPGPSHAFLTLCVYWSTLPSFPSSSALAF